MPEIGKDQSTLFFAAKNLKDRINQTVMERTKLIEYLDGEIDALVDEATEYQ